MLETPRRDGREMMLATTVILFGLSAMAQANAPANDQKPTTPTAPVVILSDTMGVDFAPYLSKNVVPTVRKSWYVLIPEQAIHKKGKTVIEFAIMNDGSVGGMRLVGSSGDSALDRAAWEGISNSMPFPALPSEFRGPYLKLRFSFYYNPAPGEVKGDFNGTTVVKSALPNVPGPADFVPLLISPGPLKLAPGATQQFSASLSGVKWAITGDQCTKLDCGIISASGLYTPPIKLSEPVSITVTATQVAAPFKSASTQITVLPPNSAKR
jgi:TonB family protein